MMEIKTILKIFLLSAALTVNAVIVKGQVVKEEFNWDDVMDAIIQVESRGDKNAVNPNGDCVGILQITRIVVKDVNRILGKNVYTFEDRFDVEKSKEMFRIIQGYYNKNNDIELGIRLWNVGTSVLKNRNLGTEYYKKVMKHYKGLNGIP